MIGQDDRLVVAVGAALGACEIGDLAGMRPQLRIATSPDDGVNLTGFAAHALLRHSGVDVARIERSGGSLLYSERPFPAIEAMRTGSANVLVHEAVMIPGWQRVDEVRPVDYLPIPDAAAPAFAKWSWPTGTLSPGYLPGLTEELTTLDFSDFALLCRADLADDIVELLTWCLVSTRDALASRFHEAGCPTGGQVSRKRL